MVIDFPPADIALMFISPLLIWSYSSVDVIVLLTGTSIALNIMVYKDWRMNMSMLVADIALPAAAGVGAVSPLVSTERAVAGKFAATENAEGSLVASSDSPVLSGSSQPTQFDKVFAAAKLRGSDGALSGEVAGPASQENQDKQEPAAEDSDFLLTDIAGGGQTIGLAQSFDNISPQDPFREMVSNVEPLAVPITSPDVSVFAFAQSTGAEDEAAKTLQRELQPQNNPAPLVGMSPDFTLPFATFFSTPSLNVTPALPKGEAAAGQIPLVVESEGDFSPISPDQSSAGDVAANISSNQLVTDIEQMVDKNLETTNLFDRTPTQQHPSMTSCSVPDLSASEAHAGKTPMSSALASQEAVGAVSNEQKVPEPNIPVLLASGQTQTILANPEEPVLADGKPSGNKTTVGHKTSIFSESNNSGSGKSINGLSVDPVPQKLNVAEIQVSANEVKSPDELASQLNQNLTQMPSCNDVQVLSQRSSASQVDNAANAAYSSDVSFGIRKQILESIHGSLSGGDRQISIRLNPPELGKVFMRFQEHDSQITGVLEVSQTQTRYQIEQVLPQIVRDLQDSGVQIKRLEVVLTASTDYHASQDQSLLGGWAQQNGSAESGITGGNWSADVWPAGNEDYQDSLQRQIQITDGSINILA